MTRATLKSFPPESAAELRARALRLLSRREHTRAELARKLAPHTESEAMLGEVLDALVARHQLSDARYAEERARVLAKKFGAARIRRELKAKGVAAELAPPVSAEGELERAREILRRKYRGEAGAPAERARRMRFLQYRGFGHDTIRAALGSTDED